MSSFDLNNVLPLIESALADNHSSINCEGKYGYAARSGELWAALFIAYSLLVDDDEKVKALSKRWGGE